jgi:DNA-binding phage protein
MTSTRSWDPAAHLRSKGEILAYLDAALELGDAAVILAALRDIERAVQQIAVAPGPRLQDRAASARRDDFLRFLDEAGDEPPRDGDRLG